MNSTEIMKAIDEIANIPGKNDKQALLSSYLEDIDFGKVIQFALSPFNTFGVRPARPQDHKKDGLNWDNHTWMILLNLRDRALTGNNAKQAIDTEFDRLNGDSAELLWRVLMKDLKAGFSESSVNKMKKDFIPEFPYMRCSLPKDADFDTWPWATGVISQLKADGMFFDGNVEHESVLLTSRQGQPFYNQAYSVLNDQLQTIYRQLTCMNIAEAHDLFRSGIQTHGELLVKDAGGNVLPREVGNGILNRVNKGGELPAAHYITAVLWDFIPATSVTKKGTWDVPYLDRLRALNAAVGFLKANRSYPVVEIIETRIVRSYEEAQDHYKDARKRKEEGTIAKKPTMTWKDGTSKDQVKLKQEVPVELEVYGFEEGKEGAKTTHTFGALKCKSADGMLLVDVGTGFSDALRQEINENREDWIGAIITVKANEIMYAKRGKITHSLFLPVFVERRYEKAHADTFAEIEHQFANAQEGVE